jgi:hypothetical protein
MITVTEKICRVCDVLKPIHLFHKHSRNKTGHSSECKNCKNKNRTLLRELRKVAPKMSETCECCGAKNKVIQLDHDHSDNTFRGWLCSDCNRALGHLGDNVASVERALNYLKMVEKRKHEHLRYRQLDQLD